MLKAEVDLLFIVYYHVESKYIFIRFERTSITTFCITLNTCISKQFLYNEPTKERRENKLGTKTNWRNLYSYMQASLTNTKPVIQWLSSALFWTVCFWCCPVSPLSQVVGWLVSPLTCLN